MIRTKLKRRYNWKRYLKAHVYFRRLKPNVK
jgi:hypothetical protein